MKKISLFLSQMFWGTAILFAQSNSNSITADLTLVGPNDYTPVQVGNVWHGVQHDDTKVQVTLTINHRNPQIPASDDLEKEEFSYCVISRILNGTPKQIVLNDKNTDSFTPSFIKDETTNGARQQTIQYSATFYFQKYTRNKLEDDSFSEWTPDGDPQPDYQSQESDSKNFYIYNLPNVSNLDLGKDNYYTYIYAGATPRTFNAPYDDKTGYPKGWEIDWKLGNQTVRDNSYTYAPANEETSGDKTLTLTIKNLAPDGKGVWFTRQENITIHVYKNPNGINLEDIIHTPEKSGIVANCTYAGRDKQCEYWAEIPNASSYGKWIYTWERKNGNNNITIDGNDGTLTDASFSPEDSGDYTTELTLTCVNPKKDDEVWNDFGLVINNTLKVCENPNNVEPNYVFPSGAEAYTYKDKKSDNTYNYSVTDIPTGTYSGDWETTWKRKKGDGNWDDVTDNPTVTLTEDERTTYSTMVTITCYNPNDTSKIAEGREVWRTIANNNIYTLQVYKNPDNAHIIFNGPTGLQNASHTGLDCNRDYRITIENSSDYGDWIYEWTRNDQPENDKTKSSFPLSQPEVGMYNTSVTVKCVNPGNNEDSWRTENNVFDTYTVYTQPVNPEIQKDEKNFVMVNGTYDKFKFAENNTGSPKWTYKWNGNQTKTYEVSTTNQAFPDPLQVKGEWVNENPLATGEETEDERVWLKDSTIYIVYICPQLDAPQPNKPSNLVVIAGEKLSFSIPKPQIELPNGWEWEYNWKSSTKVEKLSTTNQLDSYDTQNDAGKNPVISCDVICKTNTGDTCYFWSPSVTLKVYARPQCEEKYNHYDKNDNSLKYAMYLNDSFDAKKLYKEIGGFTGGWKEKLEWQFASEEDDNYMPIDGLQFIPQTEGEYNLRLTITNTATLTDGRDSLWFGGNGQDDFIKTYNITVLKDIPSDSIVYKRNDTVITVDEDESLDIQNEETINIEITPQGGGDTGKNVVFTITDSNGNELTEGMDYTVNNEDGKYTISMKGENTSSDYSNSIDYTLSCTITNNPTNIVKGSEHVVQFKKTISVWPIFDADIANDVFKRSCVGEGDNKCYIIETYDGLMPEDGENVVLESIGGSEKKWEMIYQSDSDSDSPASFNREGRQFYAFFNTTGGKPQSDGSTKKTYNVTAIYHINENNTQTQDLKIAVISWPKPEITDITVRLKDKSKTNTKGVSYNIETDVSNGDKKTSLDCYENDTIQLCYTLKGGYAIGDDTHDNPWVDKFGNSDGYNDVMPQAIDISEKSTTDGGKTYKIIRDIPALSQTTSSNPYKYSWKASYIHKSKYYSSKGKEEWIESDVYSFMINVLPLPEVTPNLKDSAGYKWKDANDDNPIHVYAGEEGENDVEMEYEHKNGNDNGWTYEWSIVEENGDTREYHDLVEKWTYSPALTDANKAYENKIIKVHITNSLLRDDQTGVNNGLDTTYVYPIKVWHKAVFADNFILKDETQDRTMTNGALAIREGNKISASVTATKYGYNPTGKDTYTATWYKDGNKLNSDKKWEIEENIGEIQSSSMSYESGQYKLLLQNMGPYGKPWASKEYTPQNIQIYNRPNTPVSIVQKGSGASGTMIITANVTEEDLVNHDYYLVFGYTDANGIDHDFASQQQKGPGQVRWSSQFKNEIPNDSQRDYAMKHAYVYAVWKYANGPEITSGKCKRNGNSYSIDEDFDSSTYDGRTRAAIGGEGVDGIIEAIDNTAEVRSIYTLNGVRIGSTLSGLKPGLYIVEYADGVTNKISVK